jgi:hypothetical protein
VDGGEEEKGGWLCRNVRLGDEWSCCAKSVPYFVISGCFFVCLFLFLYLLERLAKLDNSQAGLGGRVCNSELHRGCTLDTLY